MTSLGVDSLFTIILLDETIDICINSLYNDNEKTPNIPKEVFRNLLYVTTKELTFRFNKEFCLKNWWCGYAVSIGSRSS